MPFGPVEILLILTLVFLLFGVKRLPEIGKGLGEGLRELRGAGRELMHSPDKPSGRRHED
ncbi:twin-arginine translocase TatA/TatE family subunit [Deinococcus sp. UYEF24]